MSPIVPEQLLRKIEIIKMLNLIMSYPNSPAKTISSDVISTIG
jgi:hypothetical protein